MRAYYQGPVTFEQTCIQATWGRQRPHARTPTAHFGGNRFCCPRTAGKSAGNAHRHNTHSDCIQIYMVSFVTMFVIETPEHWGLPMSFESRKTSFILENHDPYSSRGRICALLGFLYRHLVTWYWWLHRNLSVCQHHKKKTKKVFWFFIN